MDFIHDFPLVAKGPETEGGGSRGRLDPVLLQPSVTPCREARLLQPRLGSLLQSPYPFLPLPPTQAKAWPSEEAGKDTPIWSIPNSLPGPLPALLVSAHQFQEDKYAVPFPIWSVPWRKD